MALRLDTAHLFGTLLQLMLWGIYSSIFGVTLWVVYARGGNQLRTPVMAAIICVYALNLVVTACTITQNFSAFARHPLGAIDYFEKGLDNALIAVLDAVGFAAVLISDSIIVWRMFVIWDRNVCILVPPAVAAVVAMVGGISLIVYDMLMYLNGERPTYVQAYRIWTIILYAITFIFNWSATSMIVWRLRKAERSLRANPQNISNSSPYGRVVLALVEGGALYTIAISVFVITYVAGSEHLSILFIDTMPRFVGIVPTIIVLKLSLGYLQPGDTQETANVSEVRFAHVNASPLGGPGVSQSSHI